MSERIKISIFLFIMVGLVIGLTIFVDEYEPSIIINGEVVEFEPMVTERTVQKGPYYGLLTLSNGRKVYCYSGRILPLYGDHVMIYDNGRVEFK